jgi:hypothetical protein
MKERRLVGGGKRQLVGMMLGALALSLVVSAQTDPFIGTWKLNVAKSKFTPGPGPQSQTSVYEAAGQGIKVMTHGTNAAGQATMTEFTANYDGKDYAVTGNPDWDQVAMKRVNANTVELTRKKMGKVVQTGTNVVSADGKTRTVTVKGTNSKGEAVDTVSVYDKQ